MKLPAHTPITSELLAALAARHGLLTSPIVRLPDTGIFNAIYLIGDAHILRIPRQHEEHYRALYRESIAVPLARRAGVRTPNLLVYDDSRTLLPVPYTIYECIPGITLDRLRLEPEAAAAIWRELGHDLALLHRSVARCESDAPLDERRAFPDPRELADSIAQQGWITESETHWLRQWLDRVAPLALTLVEPHLIHCDSQATNVMVDERSRRYVAVLDWGSCGWGDPAWDFAGIPLRAVPYLLDGYRAVGPLPADETAEARILWRHLQLALHSVPRGPQPDYSWAERPLTMLLEIMRFFLSDPGDPWRDLRPD